MSTKSSPTDVVTDADRAAEALIIDALSNARPDDGILSEEGGAEDSVTGLRWIVDPLDGTVNFLYGIPAWGVSIAVEDDDGTLAGAVFDPNLDELFGAARGHGAHRNHASIRVGDTNDLGQALIATGFSYDADARARQAALIPELLPRVRDIRRAGSAALDLCATACGRVDGYYESVMERWDRAAGELIVREAGGIVTSLPSPLGGTPGVIAAGPGLHAQLSALVG